MTETIAILVIFFILIVTGLGFYSRYQRFALISQKEQILEKDAVSLSLRITYLAELRCEQTGGYEEEIGTCVDLYKLEAVQDLMKSGNTDFRTFYSNLFGTSNIYFRNLIGNVTYDVYNASQINFTKKTAVRTPILLRNPVTRADLFGVLYVDYYS